MKNLFIKSLYFFLAFNISSYGMKIILPLAGGPSLTKKDIRESIDKTYARISALRQNNELNQGQKILSFTKLQTHANHLRQSATPLSASLENRCRELLAHLNEMLGSLENK